MQPLPPLYRNLTYGWLIVSILWGLLMRGIQYLPAIGIPYDHSLHTHSHIALLGWVYMGFFLLLGQSYLNPDRWNGFRRVFWLKQISIVGMLLSFPFQGYAAISISFSTLFVFGTYYFTWSMTRSAATDAGNLRLVKWAVWLLALSSLGPYGLGFFSARGLNHLHWYNNSIYFYLHFLYNGFFMMALLALLGKARKVTFQKNEIDAFGIATTLSVFLSFLWIKPPLPIYLLAGLGGILQLFIIIRWCQRLAPKPLTQHWALLTLLLFIVFKYTIQAVGALPPVVEWAFLSQKFTIIGYIHFIMLGIFTPYLFVSFYKELRHTKWFLVLAALYSIGFLLSECLLMGQGLFPSLIAHVPYFLLLFLAYILVVGTILGFGLLGIRLGRTD